MFLRRFYDDALAQASYMVGCQATGDALVIDPLRLVAPYLEAARTEGLRVARVTETHIHADYLSGARELAHHTNAELLLSGEGGPDWSYGFAGEAGASLLHDGDTFQVGNIRIDVMHTPGHTPEHLTFLVTDTMAADRPMGAFTGDFVFVGDVGRPDLLEKAARVEGTMEGAARRLFRSLQRFRELDDWLQIWPGHGAGSACGKGLGAVPSSTLGYERRFNWAFSHQDEDRFVEAVLSGQPDPPRYFAIMKRMNRDGPELLGRIPDPPFVEADRLAELLDGDGVVVDTRPTAAFFGGHVPGTLNIPLDGSFVTWAGWLLPYDRPLYLLVDDEACGRRALRDLIKIGLDRVEGFVPVSAVGAWARGGGNIQKIDQLTPAEVHDRMRTGTPTVVDVRWSSEWEEGHIPGAAHLPLGYLDERVDALPNGRPLVLSCASGHRSGIAAGLLQARGIEQVINLEGGFNRWKAEDRPVEEPSVEASGNA